jgi:hypothetical protein
MAQRTDRHWSCFVLTRLSDLSEGTSRMGHVRQKFGLFRGERNILLIQSMPPFTNESIERNESSSLEQARNDSLCLYDRSTGGFEQSRGGTLPLVLILPSPLSGRPVNDHH